MAWGQAQARGVKRGHGGRARGAHLPECEAGLAAAEPSLGALGVERRGEVARGDGLDGLREAQLAGGEVEQAAEPRLVGGKDRGSSQRSSKRRAASREGSECQAAGQAGASQARGGVEWAGLPRRSGGQLSGTWSWYGRSG